MQLHETSVSLLLSCTLPYVLAQACTHRTQATLLTMVCILRYRRIVSNNCTDGLREKYTAKAQMCPGKAPHGLHVATTDGRLVAEQGHNATFIILMEEVGAEPPGTPGQNSQAGRFPFPDREEKKEHVFPRSSEQIHGEKLRLWGKR